MTIKRYLLTYGSPCVTVRALQSPNREVRFVTGNKRAKLLPLVFVLLSAALAAVDASAWSYQVTVVGNTVNVTISGLTGNQCCGGASLDFPSGGGNCSQPCGGQQTAPLT